MYARPRPSQRPKQRPQQRPRRNDAQTNQRRPTPPPSRASRPGRQRLHPLGLHRLAAAAVVLLVWTIAGGAAGAASVSDPIAAWISPRLPDWMETYRHLHAHPELSLEEESTARLVALRLDQSGYRVVSGVGGTGVVAVLENGPGPVVLFRADMDALPVTEGTGLPYASQVTTRREDGSVVGVMHACGHDVHVTHLVALGEFMAAHRDLWAGTLLLVAQPAEELGRGALAMIEDGLFERFPRPDYSLALHVESSMPAGQVGLTSGWAMANVDAVDVTIYGRGGHGARPHQASDPIVTAAEFVMAVQTVVSRRVPPQSPAVVTVGSLHSGSKHNVIPDEAHMQITVRSYTDDVRETLLEGIREIAVGVCVTHACPQPPLVSVREHYTPAVFNDPVLAERALGVFARTLGAEHVVERAPSMGGEDFGRYGRVSGAPSLLFRLGAAPPADWEASQQEGGAPLPALHSSSFAPDAERALRTGVRASAALLMELMAPSADPDLPVED